MQNKRCVDLKGDESGSGAEEGHHQDASAIVALGLSFRSGHCCGSHA